MGMGGSGHTPLNIGAPPGWDKHNPKPGGREPRDPRRVGGKWDEGSVEQDWPIGERTKKVITDVQGAIQSTKDVSVKKRLREKLEQTGQLVEEIYKRGYERQTDRLVPRDPAKPE